MLASDQAGLFHAAQTLLWLQHFNGWTPVTIRDWPTLPTRGVLLHTGANSGPTHRRLLKQALAPLKFNALVLECEYAQWESHPELWVPELSVSKDELRKTAEQARALLIEPIPLIQTLSHMGWFFVNKENLEYGEKSLNYSIPPGEKLAWRKVYNVYEEAIELFTPKRFHIGFDEVRSLRGVFPGSKSKMEEVFVQEAETIQKWLGERGASTMIWGDMLMHRTEAPTVGFAPNPEAAAFIRQHLPKSIEVIDWQYEAARLEFPELSTLKEAGIKTLIGTWTDGPTTLTQAAALAEVGGTGLIHTTWPGRNLNDQVVEGSQYHQFASFVTAAEAAWNGGGEAPLDEGRTFAWLWSGMAPSGESQPGHALTFAGSLKVPTLPSEPTLMGEVTFHSRGGLELKQDTRFALNLQAQELAFLWATDGQGEPGATVAHLVVHDSTGKTEPIPLRIHKEVSDLQDDRPVLRAPVVWRKGGKALRCWRWRNPNPERQLESMVIRVEPEQPTLSVFGLTAVQTGIAPATN